MSIEERIEEAERLAKELTDAVAELRARGVYAEVVVYNGPLLALEVHNSSDEMEGLR